MKNSKFSCNLVLRSKLKRPSLIALAVMALTSCNSTSSGLNLDTQSAASISSTTIEQASLPPSQTVLSQMEKVANWQLPRIEDLRYIKFKRGESLEVKRWVQGAFYTGLIRVAQRSENPVYTQWISYKGKEWDWQLGKIPYFGDDQLIAQTYIWYYLNHDDNPAYLAPTITAFEQILANYSPTSLEFTPERDENGLHKCQTRWCWADALFMAPATWFGLTRATGDPKYADFAHQEVKATVDYLFDPKYDLLYRDSRFITEKGEFGEQLFWARGSGWVFAGLANIMEYIEQDDPRRTFYESLFLKMAAKLKSLQKQDGTWAMSLLAGEKIPQPETSGTAFFTYGLAWGIKNDLLNAKEYEPSVAKGWEALNQAVHPDGKLGWVQGIGAAPGSVSYSDSQIYGVGGYLLAGSAIFDIMQQRESQ